MNPQYNKAEKAVVAAESMMWQKEQMWHSHLSQSSVLTSNSAHARHPHFAIVLLTVGRYLGAELFLWAVSDGVLVLTAPAIDIHSLDVLMSTHLLSCCAVCAFIAVNNKRSASFSEAHLFHHFNAGQSKPAVEDNSCRSHSGSSFQVCRS